MAAERRHRVGVELLRGGSQREPDRERIEGVGHGERRHGRGAAERRLDDFRAIHHSPHVVPLAEDAEPGQEGDEDEQHGDRQRRQPPRGEATSEGDRRVHGDEEPHREARAEPGEEARGIAEVGEGRPAARVEHPREPQRREHRRQNEQAVPAELLRIPDVERREGEEEGREPGHRAVEDAGDEGEEEGHGGHRKEAREEAERRLPASEEDAPGMDEPHEERPLGDEEEIARVPRRGLGSIRDARHHDRVHLVGPEGLLPEAFEADDGRDEGEEERESQRGSDLAKHHAPACAGRSSARPSTLIGKPAAA